MTGGPAGARRGPHLHTGYILFQLLRLLGREPAPRGILEVAHMDQALARIEAALAAEAQAGRDAAADEETDEVPDEEGAAAREKVRVALRQRLWPIVDMIQRSRQAGEPIVWGV